MAGGSSDPKEAWDKAEEDNGKQKENMAGSLVQPEISKIPFALVSKQKDEGAGIAHAIDDARRPRLNVGARNWLRKNLKPGD